MAKAFIWKGVAVAFQSAIAAATTITAISKASPGVVSAATVPTNGALVLINALGMTQVDGRIFRVIAAGSGVFSLEGEDTTLYDTFTSGSYQVLTLGNSITSATTMNAAGGDPNFIPTTTIHDTIPTQLPGLPSALSYTFDNKWDFSDPGQQEMKKAADAGGQRAFGFQFGIGGPRMYFNGYVSFSGLPAGSAQQLVTASATISLAGRPTYYAS